MARPYRVSNLEQKESTFGFQSRPKLDHLGLDPFCLAIQIPIAPYRPLLLPVVFKTCCVTASGLDQTVPTLVNAKKEPASSKKFNKSKGCKILSSYCNQISAVAIRRKIRHLFEPNGPPFSAKQRK